MDGLESLHNEPWSAQTVIMVGPKLAQCRDDTAEVVQIAIPVCVAYFPFFVTDGKITETAPNGFIMTAMN